MAIDATPQYNDYGKTHMPSTSTLPAAVPNRNDVIVNAIGIIDQAILTLFQLRNLNQMPTAPRSMVLQLIQLHHQFKRNDRLMAQLGLLGSAGSCLMKLGKEWKSITRTPQTSRRDPYRYYKIASLAAASLLIPWLLVRNNRR